MKEGAPKKKGMMTRRGFLAGALNAGAAAGVGYAVLKNEGETVVHQPETERAPARETVERGFQSERFERERAGWQDWWELRYDQVQFIDENGGTVGAPVDFENFVVKRTKTGDDGEPEEFDYLLTPGRENEDGMLADNIAPEWLRYVEARHAREHGVATDSLSQRNITQEFEVAVARADDEPDLRESIVDAVQGGNGIETMTDLVRYYGMNPDKPVRGDVEGRDRATYLREEIAFHNRVPRTVQDELRHFIVGLAAQESRFNAGLPKNSKTAWGILQLVDTVREEHGYDKDQRLSFREEVEVAGAHFSNVYRRVRHWMQHEYVQNDAGEWETIARPETHEQLRSLFGEGQSGDEAWQKFFLTPCMINAYNAGSRRIGACLHEFVAAHSEEELQAMVGDEPGYDLFLAFTHFAKESKANSMLAGYGEDAQAYFVSIAGVSEALGEEARPNRRVASL